MAKDTEFYNPYNFVALNEHAASRKHTQDWQQVKQGNSAMRHDAWLNTHKGDKLFTSKIECSLSLLSPTMVGGKQNERGDKPSELEPYKCGQHYAIPANSLRGMISAIIETISQSNMRVMTSDNLSAREDMRSGLSAIGEIIEVDGQLKILPLKAPSMDATKTNFVMQKKWQAAFGKQATWGQVLGIYEVNYDKYGNARRQKVANPSPLDQGLWNLPISQEINASYATVYIKGIPNKHKTKILSHVLLAQNPEKQGKGLKVNLKDYTLGREPENNSGAARNTLPHTKKKEWKIPYDEEFLQHRPRLSLPQAVIDEWLGLAQARVDKDNNLPLLPKVNGTYLSHPTHPKNDKQYLARKPQVGDLLYFDITDPQGDELPVVSKISYSSIWRAKLSSVRERLDAYTPWHSQRAALTPAELLLGSVQENGQESGQAAKQATGAFASRVKFSDAKANSVQFLHEPGAANDKPDTHYLLDELSSPKPPSPAMYFKARGAEKYIRKKNITEVKHAIANGYKRYLPHPPTERPTTYRPASEGKGNNRQLITPLYQPSTEAHNQFTFTLHCENLTEAEMTLLLTALNPDKRFIHRLGIGKPLGLGMVQINIDSIQQLAVDDSYLPEALLSTRSYAALDVADFSDKRAIDDASVTELLQISCLDKLKQGVAVHYPRLPGATENYYEWFTNNDYKDNTPQYLSNSIVGEHLMPLNAEHSPAPERPRGARGGSPKPQEAAKPKVEKKRSWEPRINSRKRKR